MTGPRAPGAPARRGEAEGALFRRNAGATDDDGANAEAEATRPANAATVVRIASTYKSLANARFPNKVRFTSLYFQYTLQRGGGPVGRTLEESCKGLGSVNLKIKNQHTLC
jgi:hypothetical protein